LAYNTVQIIRDVSGNPVPQYYNTTTGQFEALQGANGANKVGIDQTIPGLTNGVSVMGSLSLPTGGQYACTNTGAAIASSQACSEVLLQADPGNTVNIAVGGTGGQFLIMTPGSVMTIPVSNVNVIYAKYVTSGTANLNYQPRS
jgi:hypothetical protein